MKAKSLLVFVGVFFVLNILFSSNIFAGQLRSLFPGGPSFVFCDNPWDIFNPNSPLSPGTDPITGTSFLSGGFYCLVGMSYQVLYGALSLLGIAVLIVLVVGGLKYMTAGGDEKAIQSAKKTLTYAFIGLGIGIASVFIMIVINSQIIATTGKPFELLIPDFFCTKEGENNPVAKPHCFFK